MTNLNTAEAAELERVFADPDCVEVHGTDTSWASKVITSLKIGAGVLEAPTEVLATQPSAGSRLREALLNRNRPAEPDTDQREAAAPDAPR